MDAMSDGNQLFIPASFTQLFVVAGARKPSASQAHIAARYELCEDLAQLLTTRAAELQLRSDAHSGQVLEQCLEGLSGPEAVVQEDEARWVVCRLAELMQWPAPPWQAQLDQ
jgi:hypothetical protein